jgi:hypothetical protein
MVTFTMSTSVVYFHDLESLEDEYINGLQFSQGADISSPQKMLKRGTYNVIFKYFSSI